MKTKLTLLLLLISVFGCTKAQQSQKPNFNFKEYASPRTLTSEKDSSLAFINLILDKNFAEAEKLYPEMFKIDVSDYMVEGDGFDPYLRHAGEFIIDYSDSYSRMALSVFLENKYNASDNVYDMLLRRSVIMDSTNVGAMFLLAKLRYDNNITNDAYFLVQQMMKLEPNNREVQRLNAWFNENHESLGEDLPTLERFLEEEVYYREFD